MLAELQEIFGGCATGFGQQTRITSGTYLLLALAALALGLIGLLVRRRMRRSHRRY